MATTKKKKPTASQVAAQKAQDAFLAQIKSAYSLTDAVLKMDTTGSLTAALEQLRAKKITDPNVAADILQKTAWFQTHGVSVTKALSLEASSPDIFKQDVTKVKNSIQDQAASLGITLSDAELWTVSRDAYIYGYDAAAITNSIVAHGKGGTGGTYGDTVSSLKAYAGQMGVKYDDQWYQTAANQVTAGDKTATDFQSAIKDIAKSKYASLADQIDKGMTVQQAASPYINSMANLLELSPNDITLDDPHINRALTNLNKDGQPAATPLWQFETQLRQDPRWAKTQNARATVDNTARNILQSFGLVS